MCSGDLFPLIYILLLLYSSMKEWDIEATGRFEGWLMARGDRFYRKMVPVADDLYDEHLVEIENN